MVDSINSATSLSTPSSKLLTALQALSSGSRINSAADNPAGMAQSESYSVQLSGNAQAMNNIQDGISLLDTASAAFEQISQGLQDIRALAVQAGNGSLNASDLQAIQGQIGQISQGIDQIASNSQFNGQKLLDGSLASLSLQVGPNAGNAQSLSLGNFSSSSLGTSAVDVTTASGQAQALSKLDVTMQQLNDARANVGALQAGLTSTLANLNTAQGNLAAAKSQISDSNFAQSASDLAQAKVQQQASLHALSVYNATQNNLLTLLK